MRGDGLDPQVSVSGSFFTIGRTSRIRPNYPTEGASEGRHPSSVAIEDNRLTGVLPQRRRLQRSRTLSESNGDQPSGEFPPAAALHIDIGVEHPPPTCFSF